MSIDILANIWYYNITARENGQLEKAHQGKEPEVRAERDLKAIESEYQKPPAAEQKAPPRCWRHQDGRKEGKRVKYYHGVWYFRGREYATLRDALLSAWPK